MNKVTRERLERAIDNMHLKADTETESFLVNFLTANIDSIIETVEEGEE